MAVRQQSANQRAETADAMDRSQIAVSLSFHSLRLYSLPTLHFMVQVRRAHSRIPIDGENRLKSLSTDLESAPGSGLEHRLVPVEHCRR